MIFHKYIVRKNHKHEAWVQYCEKNEQEVEANQAWPTH